MARLEWDNTEDRNAEYGVSNMTVMLLPKHYQITEQCNGVRLCRQIPWNGIKSITIQNEGGEANHLFADNSIYGTSYGYSECKGTIEAYTFPDAIEYAIGAKNPLYPDIQEELLYASDQNEEDIYRFSDLYFPVKLFNQHDRKIDLMYLTTKNGEPYKINFLYNVQLTPGDRQYETIDDGAEPITFSFDFTADGVDVEEEAKKLFNLEKNYWSVKVIGDYENNRSFYDKTFEIYKKMLLDYNTFEKQITGLSDMFGTEQIAKMFPYIYGIKNISQLSIIPEKTSVSSYLFSFVSKLFDTEHTIFMEGDKHYFQGNPCPTILLYLAIVDDMYKKIR